MTRPLMVGIAGGTGSGKTTIAHKVRAALPPGSAAIIEHDGYYRDHRDLPLQDREQLNYDHPDSLDNVLLGQHLAALRNNRTASVPLYDFVRHARCAETRHVEPAPVIIVEGILVFVEQAVRDLLDLKIFVDTDADIRVFRRIRRDMETRGRTFQQIREQYYRTVRPMHLQFVEPSKRWADIIIPEGGNNDAALDVVVSKLLTVVNARVAI